FRDYLVRRGITVPICPGIIPILSAAQIKRFTSLCGANIPPVLMSRLDKLGDDDEAVAEFGTEYATNQCAELLREGAPGLHLYTLNKAASTTRIIENLSLGAVYQPSHATPNP